MFFVLANRKGFACWTGKEYQDLAPALMEAERLYGSGDWDCVKVIEAGIVKAKWGPLDPGGIFNTERDEAGR